MLGWKAFSGWLMSLNKESRPDEPNAFPPKPLYPGTKEPENSEYFEPQFLKKHAHTGLTRFVPPASEDLAKDLSKESREQELKWGEKVEGSLTDAESTRNQEFESTITSIAYPAPKFEWRVPKCGEYYWSDDCLIMVLEDGPGEAVSALGEKWVMCTEVWHGERGYKKLFDGPTILPKCTEKWPGGERMLGPSCQQKARELQRSQLRRRQEQGPKNNVRMDAYIPVDSDFCGGHGL
jgi:hypothetical protein